MPRPEILDRLGAFQARYQKNREAYKRLTAEGHHPKVLFITCSDARVPPELLTGAEAGDLFVARNVANIVPPLGVGDIGMGAVIEYAILHLRVENIVICGHTDCGGLAALGAPPDWSREPHIARWIEYARTAQTKVEASGLPAEERPLAMARENVLLQLQNLRSYDPVGEAEKAGRLTLHGLVYRLEEGTFELYDPKTRRWELLEASG